MSTYILYGVTISFLVLSLIKDKKKTKMSLKKAWRAFENILPQFLVVILFVGVLLAVLNPEVISKIIGSDSGWLGVILAAVVGAVTLIPGFVAFPTAAVFMKKGVKFNNILIFIGAWSTTKIPMFLFEMTSLGVKFAVTRLLVDIPGIIIIAYALSRLISKNEIKKIYENAELTNK